MADHKWTVGQTVALYMSRARPPEKYPVTHVTATGRATVCGMTFLRDGSRYGGSATAFRMIRPWSDEIETEIAAARTDKITDSMARHVMGHWSAADATDAELRIALDVALDRRRAMKATESPGASSI